MDKTDKIKIAIVTGSTGGHFFPGLAIGEQLRNKNNVDISFFVPHKNYIQKWLKKKEFSFVTIPYARLSCKDIFSPLKFIYVFFRAFLHLVHKRFKAIVITGSYTTVPYLLASKVLGIKIFVHEQNYKMGKVTKLSKYFADKIAITFPVFEGYPIRNTFHTGFPLIKDFTENFDKSKILKDFGFSSKRLTILVFGGSQGADFLNRLITENVSYLKGLDLQFLHLTGGTPEKLQRLYDKNRISAKVFKFYFDMAQLYSCADVVICRAGAGTLTEINAWKIPAVIVPYPYAGAHQAFNASYFEERGGCAVIKQNEKNLKEFPHFFDNFLKNRSEIQKNMKNFSIVDFEEKNTNLILGLVKNEK